jgi:hypothetical protein
MFEELGEPAIKIPNTAGNIDGKTEWNIKYVKYNYGGEECFLNDKLHSFNDIPSRSLPNGYQSWHKNNKLHRLRGPAIKRGNYEEYWIEGKKIYVQWENSHEEYWVDGKLFKQSDLV